MNNSTSVDTMFNGDDTKELSEEEEECVMFMSIKTEIKEEEDTDEELQPLATVDVLPFDGEDMDKDAEEEDELKARFKHYDSPHEDDVELRNRLQIDSQDSTSEFKTSRNLKPWQVAHKCVICQKGFPSPFRLKIHMRCHTAEKPYECEVCFRRFTRADNLKVHKKYHTGQLAHRCPICTRRFVTFSNLKAHMRIHGSNKPYQCGLCLKSFSHTNYLNTHMDSHDGEQSYQCGICSQVVAGSSDLNSHMKVHRDDFPFRCEIYDEKC